jgi:hypothetical protein
MLRSDAQRRMSSRALTLPAVALQSAPSSSGANTCSGVTISTFEMLQVERSDLRNSMGQSRRHDVRVVQALAGARDSLDQPPELGQYRSLFRQEPHVRLERLEVLPRAVEREAESTFGGGPRRGNEVLADHLRGEHQPRMNLEQPEHVVVPGTRHVGCLRPGCRCRWPAPGCYRSPSS